MPAKPQPQNGAVDTGDRLSFTVFLAVAFHGLLILGLGFNYLAAPNTPPTFEVTLATHKSAQPQRAEFQAQFNQEASGSADRAEELTTTDPAPFADTQINEVRPLPETMQRQASQATNLDQLNTSSPSTLLVTRHDNPDELDTQEEQDGRDRDIPFINTEIASLRAKLDRQRQEIAERPRIRRFTSVATVASVEAEYLNNWRQKVEAFGNENFPEEALQKGIFGQLRLVTVLKADGTIASVEISKSSGHSVLDNAALQIVHRAAPYPPFPPEVRRQWDRMEIIRTWRFEITGLSTSRD